MQRIYPGIFAAAAASQQALAAITDRTPILYLRMDEVSGAPADSSGNALPVTLNGAPSAYRVAMNDGVGINLGGTADIQIAHNAVMNTDDGDILTYTYSEPCFHGRFIVNEVLRDFLYLFGKGTENTWTSYVFAVFAMANGAVRLHYRSRWGHVHMEAPAGTIAQGVEFSVGVTLGGEGLRLVIDGRECNSGMPDGRAFFGLEHKEWNTVVRNTEPIRIGITQGGVRADITVNHFAAFFRNTFADRLGLADLQTMAGTSGPALAHPIWGNSTRSADETNLQSQIDAAEAAGGGVVTYDGAATVNADIVLKTGVLLQVNNSFDLADGRTLTTPVPSLTPATLGANANQGDTSITVSSAAGMSVGDLISLESADSLHSRYAVAGSSANNEAHKFGEVCEITAIAGNVLGVNRPLLFSYLSGSMGKVWFWTPTRDCGIIGPGHIHSLHTNSNDDATIEWFVPNGALRLWLDAEIKATAVNQWAIIGCKPKGCVDLYVGPNALIGTEGSEPTYDHNGDNFRANTGDHPYGFQFSGGTGCFINRATLRSKGWHAHDALGDNFANDWGTSGNQLPTASCLQHFMVIYDHEHEPLGLATHEAAYARVFLCQNRNGGGLTLTGFRHDVLEFTARGDGRALGWAFEAFHNGMGECSMVSIDLQQASSADYVFTKRHWFESGGSRPWKNNTFRNITRPPGDDSSTPNQGPDGVYEGNTYVGVDPPLPPA